MIDLILVADIGGTNVRFAIAEAVSSGITLHDARRLQTEDFETVRDAAHAYLESVQAHPKRACMALAGPVHNGQAQVTLTNSHWSLRGDEFQKALALEELMLVNDFYAAASGVAYLHDDAFVTVKRAQRDALAVQLIIGPGTGLGQALIVPTQTGNRVVATEGGHVAFAPQTTEEIEVMSFIARAHPRVSAERLLSGPGLVNIHRAFCQIEGAPPLTLQAEEITAAAMDGTDRIALRSVNMFSAVLGRVAGDAVLATGARGGVVLGGGILPKIREMLLEGPFVDRFLDKGRMKDYMAAVPVRLIVDESVALYGAAAAMERLG